MTKILLDAGHGGQDPGAISLSGLDYEKDLTFTIVNECVAICAAEYPGWEVVLTRDSDITLSPISRRKLIEEIAPTAFVSIHCNAVKNPKANGCEVIYRDSLDEGLASSIQTAILLEFPMLRDRGIKTDIGDLRRSLAVLSTPKIPSVIVEPGFITNDSDLDILKDSYKLAGAIVRGIATWLEG